MKNSFFILISCLFTVLITVPSYSQNDKTLRPSPPAEVHGLIDSTKVDIYYSTPGVKGRGIWGELVPYGKVWRTGANEATVFETNKEITVCGQKLPAGKYGLFTIPGEKDWTFIFNSVWDQWGAFKYDSTQDVLRITVPSEHSPVFHERMLFEIMGSDVILSWENLSVKVNVKT